MKLKGKHEEKLYGLGFGRDFSDMILKAQAKKAK